MQLLSCCGACFHCCCCCVWLLQDNEAMKLMLAVLPAQVPATWPGRAWLDDKLPALEADMQQQAAQ